MISANSNGPSQHFDRKAYEIITRGWDRGPVTKEECVYLPGFDPLSAEMGYARMASSCSEDGEFREVVKKVAYLGARSEYEVECNGVGLNTSIVSRDLYLEGETITFDLDRKMMWVVGDEPDAEEHEPGPVKKKFLKRTADRTDAPSSVPDR